MLACLHSKPSARMRSEGYGTWSVCLSVCVCVCVCVCVSVTRFSATVRNKAAKIRYQRFQRYTGLIQKMAHQLEVFLCVCDA